MFPSDELIEKIAISCSLKEEDINIEFLRRYIQKTLANIIYLVGRKERNTLLSNNLGFIRLTRILRYIWNKYMKGSASEMNCHQHD